MADISDLTLIDTNGDGFITKEELKHVLSASGMEADDELVNNMSKISIEVSPEAAEVYQSASPEEQERVRVLVDLLIRKPVNSDIDFLRKLMDEISDEAEARGLTPEILESLLNEP